jgi:hypothetical protein
MVPGRYRLVSFCCSTRGVARWIFEQQQRACLVFIDFKGGKIKGTRIWVMDGGVERGTEYEVMMDIPQHGRLSCRIGYLHR